MRRNTIMIEVLRCGILAAVLLSVLALAACKEKKQQSQAPASAAKVSTVTVEPRRIMLSMVLSGRTSAYRIAEIRPRVNGLVLARLFTEGSEVKAGQALYRIDPKPFQEELNNAEAGLAQARANLPSVGSRAERYKELLGKGNLSQQDYDDAAAALEQLQAQIKSLEATVEMARINLGYTTVTAPIPGRIGKSAVTDGAIVTAYQATALATIQQMDPIYVDVPQSTTELLGIRKRMAKGQLERHSNGQNTVRLILENGDPYPLDGSLQFSDVTVDQTTGSVTLRAVFPNPDGTLLPGMFVKAVVPEGLNEQAILVPQQGVSRDHQGNPYAMVVDAANTAQRRDLVLDRAMGDQWLVTSGLGPGDRLIMEGLQRLRPGMEVEATPFEPKQPAAGEN